MRRRASLSPSTGYAERGSRRAVPVCVRGKAFRLCREVFRICNGCGRQNDQKNGSDDVTSPVRLARSRPSGTIGGPALAARAWPTLRLRLQLRFPLLLQQPVVHGLVVVRLGPGVVAGVGVDRE